MTGKMNLAKNTHQCQVVLIAGFLGSGKTTLLRQILGWSGDLSGTVVLVNEFGQLGIDGQLLQESGSQVVELANGCICCSLLNDLIKNLGEIWERFHPHRLFIEATGVAAPEDILKVLRMPRFQEHLEEPRVVTVVDADYWQEKEHLGNLFFNQVRAASWFCSTRLICRRNRTWRATFRKSGRSIPGPPYCPPIIAGSIPRCWRGSANS